MTTPRDTAAPAGPVTAAEIAVQRRAITAEGCACGKPFIQHDQHMPVYVWNALADLLNFEPVPEAASRAVEAALDALARKVAVRGARREYMDWGHDEVERIIAEHRGSAAPDERSTR